MSGLQPPRGPLGAAFPGPEKIHVAADARLAVPFTGKKRFSDASPSHEANAKLLQGLLTWQGVSQSVVLLWRGVRRCQPWRCLCPAGPCRTLKVSLFRGCVAYRVWLL